MKDQIFYVITNNIEIVIISFMLNLNIFKVYFVQSIKLEETQIKQQQPVDFILDLQNLFSHCSSVPSDPTHQTVKEAVL